MEALLYLLPSLGCGLMMVVMMVFMARGMGGSQTDRAYDDRADDIASLRDEMARLRSDRSAGTGSDG